MPQLYDSAYPGESVGNDRLTRLAQFEGDDEGWWAKLHAPQDYRDSAREAAPNMFDWRGPLGKSEWPNGGRQEAHGSHPRKEGVEGIARETHAAGATAVHRCRLGARTRPGSGGGGAELITTTRAIPTGDARGWSGRSSNYTSSSHNYAYVASLSDVLDQAPDFDG